MADVKFYLLAFLLILRFGADGKQLPSPGFGYPGSIAAYQSSPELSQGLQGQT